MKKATEHIDRLTTACGTIARWLLLVMVLLAAFNAIARYLGKNTGTNLSSNTLLELQWYLFSGVFLLGAAYTMKRNEHVRVDVLYEKLSAHKRAWLNILGILIFLIPFCILIIWTCWNPVLASWKSLEMSPDPGGLPRYPIKTLIPVCFVLLILQSISELIKNGRILNEPESAP